MIDYLDRTYQKLMAFFGSLPDIVTSLDPLVLMMATAVSASLATAAAMRTEDVGLIMRLAIAIIVAMLVFGAALGLAYLGPVLFSLDSLVRSQVRR